MFVSLRQPRCGFWFPFATGLGRLAPKRTPVFLAATLFIGLGSAQTITTQFTARLTESGDNPPLAALVADAQAAPDSLTSALRVTTPNEQAPRLLNLVNPAIAIPFDSKVREIEAFWNGVPLPLIDPSGTLIAQEAHSYGGMIPFFKPLFSVAAIPVGNGTLEIRAFDSAHSQVAAVSITNLTIVRSPPPLDPDVIRGTGHPRIYLGAGRLAAAAGRSADDVARQRFEAALNRFLAVLADIPDVTSAEFENQIYDPEDYIPLLGLAYQLHKDDDSTIAPRAAGAARSLTLRIASDYDTGVRNFGRDTGYDIRFGLRNLMLAYDWLYDEFSPSERDLIVKVATNWIDWYHNTPGYVESWPAENYYAGYLQGITLTAFATAGDNPAAGRFFNLLWSKLLNEVPVMNQYLAGGDWAEGWNYGPYSVTEFALVNTVLRDAGVDWSADFDWLQHLPRSLLYQVAPDFSETRSYGGYSGNYPHKTSPAMLATLSTTTQDNGYADYLYRSMNANPNNDFVDATAGATFYEMIFASRTAIAPDLSALPLSYFNSGTGRFFSRSSLTDTNAYFVSTENTSYSFDHYGYANGDVRLYHGGTCLVCPSAYRGPDFDGEAVTPAFSTYRVNGRDQDLELSRNNQNLFTVENGSYSASAMRFESSWASSRYDENIVDPADPLDYLIRETVHLRPGTLIVRDLHRRRHVSDTLSGRWHVGLSDAVQNVSGGYRIGALQISTFYPQDVSVSFSNDNDGGGNRVGTVMQMDFASSIQPLELVTVFSETLTATSYTNQVLTLSDGSKVTFAQDGTISVGGPGPQLLIRLDAGDLVVSWSSSFPSYSLEWTSALSGTPLWNAASGSFRTSGGFIEYRIPVASLPTAQFYRLHKR